MNRATKFLKAFDDATVALSERGEKRRHLGASALGKKCDRQIWYGFRWAHSGEEFEPHMLRLFRRGHREEPEIVRIVRGIPDFEVWDAGDNGPYKEAFRITFADGHGGGTADGGISGTPDYPDSPALLEFKTYNDANFAKLTADGVQTNNWEYFVQMQLYLDGLELPRALFIAVNKDNDSVHAEYVEANPTIAATARERAAKLIAMDSPPDRVSDSPGFWLCRYCQYKNLCHFSDIPAINCRTCAFASVGPAGTWKCARGEAEIATQQGCASHIFEPALFRDIPKFEVLEYGPEMNWIRVFDGIAPDTWGPRYTDSKQLAKNGFVPF